MKVLYVPISPMKLVFVKKIILGVAQGVYVVKTYHSDSNAFPHRRLMCENLAVYS